MRNLDEIIKELKEHPDCISWSIWNKDDVIYYIEEAIPDNIIDIFGDDVDYDLVIKIWKGGFSKWEDYEKFIKDKRALKSLDGWEGEFEGLLSYINFDMVGFFESIKVVYNREIKLRELI